MCLGLLCANTDFLAIVRCITADATWQRAKAMPAISKLLKHKQTETKKAKYVILWLLSKKGNVA